ncbi:hypothetical protein BKA59DRAFT_512826 [Fusarium tricinctum]|uniref:Uncharacterized protein n=1 Tax=Fusarium tricinctum TaxID=61284 RepID=A0A8K0RSX1_9HYPO|nr:hypothetical protein BKA59DRAFT_512826 [Fusarium tricinctum]
MTTRFWRIAFLAAIWYTAASSAPQSNLSVLHVTTPSRSQSTAANFATPVEAASTTAVVIANSEASSNLIDAWAQTNEGLGVSTTNIIVNTVSDQTTGDSSSFSDLTSTLTTTDSDHNPIVIFPFGWLWGPVGVLPLVAPPAVAPPAPTLNPGLESVVDHGHEDYIPSSLSNADEMSATRHESTKATSYISGSTYTRTGTETCSSPESCPWSKQSTTTTTASEAPFLFMNGEVEPEAYPDPGNVGEKIIKYFEKMFEEAGVARASDVSVAGSVTDTRFTEAPTSTTSQPAQASSTPSTTNSNGTTIHIEDGCVLVNGSPRCALGSGNSFTTYESTYSVNLDPNKPNSTALILSGFDGSNDNHLHSTATCQLLALWPSTYGDVTFAKDGCLYDAAGNKIFDQCCGSPDGDNNGPVVNPYVAPAPPDAQQVRGNHDGSAICRSISKATCLAAAARYMDDIVYHKRTSAVWPDGTGEDITNMILPVVGPAIEQLFGINYGCTVIWTCEKEEDFESGMTGKAIKFAMLNIYSLNGAKGCGSTYLDNGCHITVNGCNNCRDVGRQGTLWNPYSVANDEELEFQGIKYDPESKRMMELRRFQQLMEAAQKVQIDDPVAKITEGVKESTVY